MTMEMVVHHEDFSSDNDDMTEEMSVFDPPTNPHVPEFMETAGLLCGNGEREMPYHGLLPAAIQDVWRTFNADAETSSRANLAFTGCRFAACLENLAFDMRKVAQDYEDRGMLGSREYVTHLSSMGFQAMALGMWVTFFGPYKKEHSLNVLQKVCKGAAYTNHENMANWILGLSMGMECHDTNVSPSWKLIQHESPLDVEIIPGWPVHTIRIPETPRRLSDAVDVDDESREYDV